MGKRHLTPREIINNCNMIARESRTRSRSTWTAMSILLGYATMKAHGFKGKRINDLIQIMNGYEDQYEAGTLDLADMQERMYQKAGWKIEYVAYQESDIRGKKGSYDYWYDSVQLPIQNDINRIATCYLTFYFNALIDKHGFGKDRLEKVYDEFINVLKVYENDKSIIDKCKLELLEDGGIYFENPIDPLTQTSGSLLTGR